MIIPIKFQSILVKKIEIAKDVFELRLSRENAPKHEPGQFHTIQLPKIEGELPASRAYSIASLDSDQYIILLIKLLDGRGSKYVKELQEGDVLNMNGPMGMFKHNSSPDTDQDVFVCTSTGIVPFLPFITDAYENNNMPDRKITLIFGVRHFEDLFYEEELKILADKFPNFQYKILFSQEEISENSKNHHQGRVTKYMEDNLFQKSHTYLCGNPAMIDDILQILEKKGQPKEHITYEKY